MKCKKGINGIYFYGYKLKKYYKVAVVFLILGLGNAIEQ
jgi:hypothetical protein